MPEIINLSGESLKEDWMPEVGQEFEWMRKGVSYDWNYGYFIGLDKDGDMVIQREEGLDGLATTDPEYTYKFRPLKTEREKFIELGMEIVSQEMNGSSHEQDWDQHERTIIALIKNDWRPVND